MWMHLNPKWNGTFAYVALSVISLLEIKMIGPIPALVMQSTMRVPNRMRAAQEKGWWRERFRTQYLFMPTPVPVPLSQRCVCSSFST